MIDDLESKAGNEAPEPEAQAQEPASAEPEQAPEQEEVPKIKVTSERELKRMNRREILKLTPVLLVGAFAFEKLSEPLLKQGLAFSDWSTDKLFSRSRLANTF